MLTETPQPSRPLAPLRDGEPCPSCGTPLAGDQRYCLQCGARRPEARLEFLDVLDADVRSRSLGLAGAPSAYAAPAVPPGPGAPLAPRGVNARLQENTGALALGALVLLTLLIGLLLGHWVSDARRDAAPAAAAPAPQVIKVEGTAPAAADGAGTGDGATSAGGDGSAGSEKGAKGGGAKAKSSSSSSEKATAPKDSVSVKSLTSKKAVDDAVKKGKPISTGTGKLPPKDDKPAGGGSGFEEIG